MNQQACTHRKNPSLIWPLTPLHLLPTFSYLQP